MITSVQTARLDDIVDNKNLKMAYRAKAGSREISTERNHPQKEYPPNIKNKEAEEK